MIRFLQYLAISIFILSCNNQKKNIEIQSIKSGGNLKLAIFSNTVTTYPPSIDDESSKLLAYQIHMGLFQYNPKNLTLGSGICKSWDIDNTGKVYIFYLDSTVYFHNDPCFKDGIGRRVTAHDFTYTFKILATQSTDNKNFTNTISRIKGAKEFYKNNNKNAEIEGIEVINDFTLKITLDSPSAFFMYNLAHPAVSVLAHEAIEKYGKLSKVGAGPYYFAQQNESVITLARNPNFFIHDDTQFKLPYIDTLEFKSYSSQEDAVKAFKNKEINALLFVASTQIPQIIKQIENSVDYTLTKSLNSNETNNSFYNILNQNIQELYTNNLRILNLSKVYFDKEPH